MILMTGAAGPTGLSILRQLGARGANVRVLSRSEEGAERCKVVGATEAVLGDLRSAEDLKTALAGIDKVYHIGPRFQGDEYEIGVRLIDAAKAEGVSQFAFHSLVHPQCSRLLHHWQKLRVEEYLIESLVPYTILSPTMYMQNIGLEWPTILKTGIYRRFYSINIPLSVVDLDDVGEAAAIMLTEEGWTGGSFEMCSSSPLSHAEMAKVFADVTGRDIRAEQGDIDIWEAAARKRGQDDYSIEGFVKMCAHYDAYGLPGGNGKVLGMILGRIPNDYSAFADKWAAAHPAT
ncbi:MAG: NmrA family NAD(P)-binding protein [Alphaproteobacteria bacterium]|nr:NmrA family NAD(P)-binding protein [Alphaproteobacteria bacterium]